MRSAEGRARLAISIGAIAVFAWGFGPLLVRDIDAPASTIVFWRLWIATPVMVTAAYLTGGRVSVHLLKIVFVPGARSSGSRCSSASPPTRRHRSPMQP